MEWHTSAHSAMGSGDGSANCSSHAAPQQTAAAVPLRTGQEQLAILIDRAASGKPSSVSDEKGSEIEDKIAPLPSKLTLDSRKLGPQMRLLSRRHTTAEMRVLARLTSASHDFIAPPPRTRNPLLRAWRWWCTFLLPGMGMFSQAYFIFSIGNIRPLLAVQMPNCFGGEQPYSCSQSTEKNIQNVEISAIIVGMLSFGFVADAVGRKWCSRLTMLIMFVGACLLTGAYGPTDQVFLSVFCFSLFFYSLGVGGEYPLASCSAAERAEADPELRQRRGETVVLTFTQQGWGNFVNSLVILILLAIVGATSTVSPSQAELTWRLQFGVGAIICFAVAIYRLLYLQESPVWKAEHEGVKQELLEQKDSAALAGRTSWRKHWVIFKFYWPRLLITCICWAASDFAFYGNKLFQSRFIDLISPGATRFKAMQWTLLNSFISLVGYYFSAFTIDRTWMGRKRLQAIGFTMMFLLFLSCAVFFDQLVGNSIHALQALYFLTAFFNQAGPNCTCFLVAGEVYPTDVRAFFHGISAAAGKLGAIAAATIFTRISTPTTFYCSAGAGLLGALLTVFFMPDTTGLPLAEIDRLHRYMIAGQMNFYHGPAVKAKHLSHYERWRGYGEHYDPEEDDGQRMLQQYAQKHPIESLDFSTLDDSEEE